MILHSLRSSQRPVMMTTTPACLRRVSGPLQIHRRRLVCTLRLKLFGPSSLQNHRIPQTVPSSSFSRRSSPPSCLFLPSPPSSTLLCYSAPLFSVQTKPPDLLSPSFGSPDLFGSASMKRLHHSTQPQILSSTLRIRSATPQPCPSLQCVQAVPTQPPSPPLSPPLVTKSQFAVCSNYPNLRSKHFTGSSWVISVKLLRFQYGNIGSRSLCLNSTIAFFSTSVEHIQVVAKHLGTQRLCWIFISKFRHLRFFLLSNSFEIHIV
ncbi:unnamed protein product [Brassica oleracea var. botrytis]